MYRIYIEEENFVWQCCDLVAVMAGNECWEDAISGLPVTNLVENNWHIFTCPSWL